MKWNDVLEKHGKYDSQYIESRLTDLGNDLFDHWYFINAKFGVTRANSKYFVYGTVDDRLPIVGIGDVFLSQECGSGEMNKAAYVQSVNQMFHEYRHTQQRAAAFSEYPDSRMDDMVRRHFVTIFYPSVYKSNYLCDPTETDAILYGLKKSLEYFESDPVISKADAETVLFEYMTADDNQLADVLKPYEPKSIYDIISAFEDINSKAYDRKYDFDPEVVGPKWDMTDLLIFDPSFKEDLAAFENARTGREQDEILERTIVSYYPEVVKRIPRLENELMVLQEHMNDNSEHDFTDAVRALNADTETYAL